MSIRIDIKRKVEAGRKIQCELMVLWGEQGVIEKYFDPVREWQNVSDQRVQGRSLLCGHFIAEEAPELLLDHILPFLDVDTK